jgi:hypothetical protein
MWFRYEFMGGRIEICPLGFWLAQPPGLGAGIRCLAFLELLEVVWQVNRQGNVGHGRPYSGQLAFIGSLQTIGYGSPPAPNFAQA